MSPQQKFQNDDYNDVASRIVEFREKYPDGCLRPMNPEVPYRIETVGGRTFIVYLAAAYRAPDDPTPGVGAAWEPVPGPTNFTKDSELQNAETSAWGRAIVAVLAADTKKGIASANEVRNRSTAAASVPSASGGPACVSCGGSLANAAVRKTSDGYVHKDGCPGEASNNPLEEGSSGGVATPPGDSPALPLEEVAS